MQLVLDALVDCMGAASASVGLPKPVCDLKTQKPALSLDHIARRDSTQQNCFNVGSSGYE